VLLNQSPLEFSFGDPWQVWHLFFLVIVNNVLVVREVLLCVICTWLVLHFLIIVASELIIAVLIEIVTIAIVVGSISDNVETCFILSKALVLLFRLRDAHWNVLFIFEI
jgi:hypothetical protein